MVRSLLLTIVLLLFAGAAVAQSTSALEGTVTDDTGETLIGASVKVKRGSEMIRGAVTDVYGRYRVVLDPGTYDVEVSYTGFTTALTTGVSVLTSQINKLDIVMTSGAILETVTVIYEAPLIEQDKTQAGSTLTSAQIRNLPTRSVNAIVALTAGTTSIDGGGVNIRGARENATNYYLDGIRVTGSIPVQDIEQLQVVTGGLGAEYGDVTGGVISVISKGPASEYHGALEIENSHYLDPYGWLLGTANLSGPIWRKKSGDGSERTIVGFRLSGQYNSQVDDDPPALPVYRPRQDVLDRLSAHPLRQVTAEGANGQDIVNEVNSAEYLTRDDIEVLDHNPYEDRTDIDLTGKLDFRLTNMIDLSLTGTYKDVENQFTPGGWQFLNAQNNPTDYAKRYRGIARFRHRLGSDDVANDAGGRRPVISNANYQLQFGFERATDRQYDPRHEDRLFDYGYVGKYDFDYLPSFELNDSLDYIHTGYLEFYQGFTPGYTNGSGQQVIPNPGYMAYNEFANTEGGPQAYNSFYARNGFMSGVYNNIYSGMHTNINQIFNRNSRQEDDVITVGASAGLDLNLGRTGTHSIQFGLLNEQRTNRFYNIAPRTIWELMDQNINLHINGLDSGNVVGQYWHPTISPFIGDSLDLYATTYSELQDNRFYRAIRESLGRGPGEFLNVHELSPEQLSLSMFSPRELTEQGLVYYYGYDYLGNKAGDNVTFNDFFTTRSPVDNIRTFPVAPLRPVYQAAYLRDKFTFNKMIFSLGLRVEQFDLNTRVMKDQYSLYQIQTAENYFNGTISEAGPRPANIGDDFKVYVQSQSDLRPKAFRNGDTWYFADGTQANDGNLIFGGGVVQPLLADTITGDDIFNENFDPNTAFEDYTPQLNWLPRLAFSFPISKEANFFAHYDILAQRPPENWQVTPLDYLYFYVPGRTTQNNANLKPERVVDYEVGFQQLLTSSSSLKFSAYYREQRDMVQARTLLYIPTIGQYETTGNEDFGTVKGFTMQYNLRRLQNIEMQLAYTLQFAEGTGSSAQSQRGLTSRGNLRTLFPLNYDERHNVQAVIDYRYGSGDRYTGPRIGGVDILSNFGVNMQTSAVSGRPYTAKIRPTLFGGEQTAGAINGNRLPWRFTIDLRVDKSFNLSPAGKTPLNLNVYFRVANLLDTRNIVGVYPASGTATDAGFLASPEGQIQLRDLENRGQRESFETLYSYALQNSDFYTRPRRLYLGAVFEF